MANEDTFHLGIKAVIRNSQGNILLLHANLKTFSGPTPDHWDLPGGRLQKGQDLKTTLQREVEEEIGITDITIGKLLDASISNLRITKGDYGLILLTYLCSVTDIGSISITDDENLEFAWFTPKQAAKKLSVKFSNSLVQAIEKL